ncbi:DUF4265 domain-containing protein [Streptomyces sp. NBC_01483]|uniref:DUF4265 domain-containing protein n=1 Tax=Streptomyces sp. NBC_01483 TaxID=2903883 RepID=UPI002E305764|nr:DUF4265 domain-containing protein [Streptomyces sp. NBC_01483]
MIDLSPFGFTDTFEQVWLENVGGGLYRVCCIPFHAYGISLGDTVELSPANTVLSLTEKSGHRSLRILFKSSCDARVHLTEHLAKSAFQCEWDGDGYVAIDQSPQQDMASIFRIMSEAVDSGEAHWEWSDARKFSAGGASDEQV